MSIESKEKKTQIIESLQEAFSKCSIGILTDYRGLNTSEMTMVRRKLQESDIEYKVVKNTLARFAAERAGMDDLANSFDGPIAIAFGANRTMAILRRDFETINWRDIDVSSTGWLAWKWRD